MCSSSYPKDLHQAFSTQYNELHQLAQSIFSQEHGFRTIQPTALIHEVFIRLSEYESDILDDPKQFMIIASSLMRQILVDQARARNRIKRGRTWKRVELNDQKFAQGNEDAELIELHESLDRLKENHSRQAAVMEMRLFGGFDFNDIARTLEISLRTAQLDWKFARSIIQSERVSNS